MVVMGYFIIFMDFLTKLKNMETFKIIMLMVSCVGLGFYLESIAGWLSSKNTDLINGNFTNKLHPLVKEIYELFINEETVNDFKEEYCKITINETSWWSANDIYSREFTNIPVILQKKYNATMKEINDSLSLADKKST